MRLAGSSSWRISEDRWPEPFDVALWFGAAERIDVVAEGVVPGAPDVEPLPDASTDPSDAARTGRGLAGLVAFTDRAVPAITAVRPGPPAPAAGCQPARFPRPGSLACAAAGCQPPVATGP